MKSSWTWGVLLGAALAASSATTASAQAGQPGADTPAGVETPIAARRIQTSDWSGPRVGFMVAPGDPRISNRLREHGLGSVVSQFGWQLERRVRVPGGGPDLVTEIVPMFGGVEYGKFVPSLNAMVGLRLRSGLEFGMGPSLSMVATTAGPQTGLLVAVGKSLEYGDVCIPINLAVSTNPNGAMINLIAGYAINRAAR